MPLLIEHLMASLRKRLHSEQLRWIRRNRRTRIDHSFDFLDDHQMLFELGISRKQRLKKSYNYDFGFLEQGAYALCIAK